MGEETAISWTDHTFNPWIGCTKVSAECDNCYAEATDKRFNEGKHWGAGAPRRMLSESYWKHPHRWNVQAEKDGVRRRVFCASQADVFERRDDLGSLLPDLRGRLFSLISSTPHLDWLLLSKRPENMREMLPWLNVDGTQMGEPWPNVWLGTTCGVRSSLPRIQVLRSIPAAKRFVSCEPILEHITAEDWDRAFGWWCTCDPDEVCRTAVGSSLSPHRPDCTRQHPVHWLIVGDESGRHRRHAQLDWIRTAREAALRHRVAFHFKQSHASGKLVHLPVLDGRQWAQFPK